jgi:hypothetical protein
MSVDQSVRHLDLATTVPSPLPGGEKKGTAVPPVSKLSLST